MIETAYKKFCKERFPLPSKAQVADLELRLGIELPQDFRQYLLEYNGGLFTEPHIVPPPNGCPLDRLTVIGGIEAPYPTEQLGTERGYTPAQFEDNDPPQILPIGYTIMGNLLLLSTKPGEEDWGWISLKKAYVQEYFFLAKGIKEFFGLLREPVDE